MRQWFSSMGWREGWVKQPFYGKKTKQKIFLSHLTPFSFALKISGSFATCFHVQLGSPMQLQNGCWVNIIKSYLTGPRKQGGERGWGRRSLPLSHPKPNKLFPSGCLAMSPSFQLLCAHSFFLSSEREQFHTAALSAFYSLNPSAASSQRESSCKWVFKMSFLAKHCKGSYSHVEPIKALKLS